jgi:hypothetical protein
MVSIRADFRRFSEVTLQELIRAVGVYVLWSSHSSVRPTNIGEGELLTRINSKSGELAQPLDGVLAILNHKVEAEIAEAVLLHIAEDVGRRPPRNRASGKWASIGAVFEYHGKIKLCVSGKDPLKHPAAPLLRGPNFAELIKRGDSVDVVHSWRRS